MRSDKLGASTSQVEVANISKQGFGLFLGGRELFVFVREVSMVCKRAGFEDSPCRVATCRPFSRISTSIFRSNPSSTLSGFRSSPAPNPRVQRTRSSPSAGELAADPPAR